MKYVGVDLHKKVISVCVVKVVRGRRQVDARARFDCADPPAIEKFFSGLKKFRMAVEATASYEWFVQLVEPLADRVVLVHPKKMRVIAESTRKTDRIDAQILAEFLAQDMLPRAWRPTPRVREHRILVRHRRYLTRRITSVKNKLRHLLANYNADVPHLFTTAGQKYLAKLKLRSADRLVIEQLRGELDGHERRLREVERELAAFAERAPLAEREARELLASVPGVGSVTTDVVLSELGDWTRFRSEKDVASYAGLAPGRRESAGKSRDLGITKEGSRLLRWAMVQLAWRLAGKSPRWRGIYRKLEAHCGAKKAIVAVARRLLSVLFAVLRTGQAYRLAGPARATCS
jgi:transposase